MEDGVCVIGLEARGSCRLCRLYELLVSTREVSLEAGPIFFDFWLSFPHLAIIIKHYRCENNIVRCIHYLHSGEQSVAGGCELNGVFNLVE